MKKCWVPKFMAFCSLYSAWIFWFQLSRQFGLPQDPYQTTLSGTCHLNNKTSKKPLMLMPRLRVSSWECQSKLHLRIEILTKRPKNRSKYLFMLNLNLETWSMKRFRRARQNRRNQDTLTTSISNQRLDLSTRMRPKPCWRGQPPESNYHLSARNTEVSVCASDVWGPSQTGAIIALSATSVSSRWTIIVLGLQIALDLITTSTS